MATISKEAEMEFTTTIGDLPKQVKRHQLAPTTKIRVIVEEMKKKGKARYIYANLFRYISTGERFCR
jgi:hypothetical protein